MRRKIFMLNISKTASRKKLRIEFKKVKKQKGNIIELDVKRTYSSSKHFNQKALEIILKNINDKKIGNFEYY